MKAPNDRGIALDLVCPDLCDPSAVALACAVLAPLVGKPYLVLAAEGAGSPKLAEGIVVHELTQAVRAWNRL